MAIMYRFQQAANAFYLMTRRRIHQLVHTTRRVQVSPSSPLPSVVYSRLGLSMPRFVCQTEKILIAHRYTTVKCLRHTTSTHGDTVSAVKCSSSRNILRTYSNFIWFYFIYQYLIKTFYCNYRIFLFLNTFQNNMNLIVQTTLCSKRTTDVNKHNVELTI